MNGFDGAQRSSASGPPRAAAAVLTYCLPAAHREAVLGDLEEGFALLSSTAANASPGAVSRARGWYWGQVARSIWPALTIHAGLRSIGRLLGAIFLGFATMWIVGDVLLVGSRTLYMAFFPASPSTQTVLRVTYLVSMIPTCVLAGYFAGRSGGSVGRLAAVTLGMLLVIPALISPFFQQVGDPLWARMVWIVSGPVATLYGANR